EALHVLVSGAKRLKVEPLFDQLKDRSCVVVRMIYRGLTKFFRDQQSRDARAWAPGVMSAVLAVRSELRRRHMIPPSAEFVIGHDDQRILAVRTIHNFADQIDKVRLACGVARIARMLVRLADRLHKAHWLEDTVPGGPFERLLVKQVIAAGLCSRGASCLVV